MEQTLDGLGLGDAVIEAARAAGYEAPTPLQSASAKVLRRGGNVVLHASSGSGVTAAFGMPLLDRLAADDADAEGVRAVVLAPTQDRAESLAQGLAVLAGATGISVRAIAAGWRTQGSDVIVTTAQRALEAVETSELKLDAIMALVIVDAADALELGAGTALDTLITLVPRDAQRVVATAELTSDVEKFVDAHVRKALTVPARPAAPPRATAPAESAGQIGYMIVEEGAKPEVLARLLASVEEDALVFTRTAARAERVQGELARRGIADGTRGVRVAAFDAAGESASRIISYDVPFSAEQLKALHATGGTVLVTAGERAHFRRIAAEVPFTVKHRRARPFDATALDAFRSRIADAIESEDLDAQLLVLDPLLEEHSAAEVAAALCALLRRRAPEPAAGAPTTAPAAATGAPPVEATTGGLTRLFISIGSRDNIRPGDLVGAITGEANIKGEQVGRVDIRESFSVVEVAAAVAERVIRALNGTTMKGRSLRVDFDRKGGGSPASRERGGPPRGGRGPGRSGPGDRPRAPRGDAAERPRGPGRRPDR